MRQIKEILRLKNEFKLSVRDIARSCAVPASTVADATVADAILDRLVHNAYSLNLKGEFIRKTKNSLAGK